MVNRYPGKCHYCGGHVAARAGKCWRPKGAGLFVVAHLACDESGEAKVIEFATSSGWRGTRNARGRCEDAPCCGCCTC